MPVWRNFDDETKENIKDHGGGFLFAFAQVQNFSIIFNIVNIVKVHFPSAIGEI